MYRQLQSDGLSSTHLMRAVIVSSLWPKVHQILGVCTQLKNLLMDLSKIFALVCRPKIARDAFLDFRVLGEEIPKIPDVHFRSWLPSEHVANFG